ncbi:hypothetical protein B0H14DRAFT_3538003 [Mycena olivaceomarginata]|nr:hypothetical protein B0H14DRAFT_3538003 [Mycena olivaceomarginata]
MNICIFQLFTEDDADKIIADHMVAFLSIVYPQKSETWLTDMAPLGKLKAWIQSNTVTPPPSYLTQDEFDRQKTELLEGGMAGPLSWYKQFHHRCGRSGR